MLYQHTLCTTVPQRIRHKDPYAAAERERLEERATQSAVNHDRTGCRRKAPLYAGQSVSVINNDRTLWLPATVIRAADHCSYIVKVIGGAEYRRAQDHIRECHLDAVKPDTHPKVEVAGQPVTTPSTSEAVQLQQVHPHTMDQDLKTLKDTAYKAYLQNQSHTPTIRSLSIT